MKRKIGTQLEEEVYHQLKRRAVEERQPISDILQAAIVDYLGQGKRPTLARSGLQRFLARKPSKLPSKQIRENLESDFYEQ